VGIRISRDAVSSRDRLTRTKGLTQLEARTTEQAERIRTLEAQVAALRQMVQALTATQQKQP